LALTVLTAAMMPGVAVAGRLAPLRGMGQRGVIPERFIVVMKSWATEKSMRRMAGMMRARGGRVTRKYRAALKGDAATLTPAALAAVRGDPAVAYVEADAVVRAAATQLNPQWGLDRIDQTGLPLTGSYSYGPTGAGVNAYIIDTGVQASHPDFGGRARLVKSFVFGEAAEDANGHGTYVAGIIGGAVNGVAKQVTLLGVKVLNGQGSGTYSDIIAGVDWVTSSHQNPAVANLSLSGPPSTALDDAVEASIIKGGVSYTIAAGNSGGNACTSSPARAPHAITVGASTPTDARASFSNVGPCVDVFAPGVAITSDWSPLGLNTISGTSGASAYVAGVITLYLQQHPTAPPITPVPDPRPPGCPVLDCPTDITTAVLDYATRGKIAGLGPDTPNRLINSLVR
jgi:subtilisin family serine protease